MIKSVTLGEEIVITTKNKSGILADISTMLANNGVNIDAIAGYEVRDTGVVRMVTSANICIVDGLKKKGYKHVEETEVIMVDLENKPGALKVVTTELGKNSIDIQSVYVTSSSAGGSSRMVLKTNDNEKAMALLSRYTS